MSDHEEIINAERDEARATIAQLVERLRQADENAERLENLVDVAEHNLHEARADLKERDAMAPFGMHEPDPKCRCRYCLESTNDHATDDDGGE